MVRTTWMLALGWLGVTIPLAAAASQLDPPSLAADSLRFADAGPEAVGSPLGPRPTLRPPLRVPIVPADSSGRQSEVFHGWFYRGLPYGSESLVHPIRLILDGGFGILQFDNRDNRLGSVDFRTGWRNVWDNLAHPVRAIEVEGWSDFFQREIIPISFNSKRAQYWPNYTLHLIGGGMSYTMMREWYQWHGYPRPRAWAIATLTTYHVLNEVVENGDLEGPTTDPIADLYVFDPLSIVLFSHEGVNEFFSRRLHLSDWSGQPTIDLSRGAIENHGQHFSIKWALPYVTRWSLFYHFGNHGEAGLSFTRANGSSFSAALGMRARELVDLEDNSRTTKLVPEVGLFYDRNGSLLFSAQWADTRRSRLRLNAYPGLLRAGRFAPGWFFNLDREGHTMGGVMFTALPVGLATPASR